MILHDIGEYRNYYAKYDSTKKMIMQNMVQHKNDWESFGST